jgi:hypothetical protein
MQLEGMYIWLEKMEGLLVGAYPSLVEYALCPSPTGK